MLSLYLDSAVRAGVERLLRTGVFRGITTNPNILHKAGLSGADIPDVYRWAVDGGAQDVFLQTWGRTHDEMFDRAQQLLELGDRVIVKVPATREGIPVAGRLVRTGAPVLLTAVYSLHQAVTAGAIGVDFVAPYLGKVTEEGGFGRETVAGMQRVLRQTRCSTRVLAASIRTTPDMTDLSQQGVDAFALPVTVADRLFEDLFTDVAAKLFDGITSTW